MTIIKRSALLPYPAQRVYALVNDIESYPQYMGGCIGARVLRREPGVVEARLELARAGIVQSFATRNLLREFDLIELQLLDGPFDSFTGRWQFLGLGDLACKVSLDLEFSFNNSVLGVAAGKLFESATSGLVDTLSRRAKQLYG
jgi:ribosome-associated toxin RatA of RatAB toxin-antitoxin module